MFLMSLIFGLWGNLPLWEMMHPCSFLNGVEKVERQSRTCYCQLFWWIIVLFACSFVFEMLILITNLIPTYIFWWQVENLKQYSLKGSMVNQVHKSQWEEMMTLKTLISLFVRLKCCVYWNLNIIVRVYRKETQPHVH